MTARNKRRNVINNFMLALSGMCAFLTVSTLFLILAYYQGWIDPVRRP